MIDIIKSAASDANIAAFISNSTEKIEVQLNNITREEDLPIMLISWDLDVTLTFDENGFLNNPDITVVALLVSKPETLEKSEQEATADKMALLFQSFLSKLYTRLVAVNKTQGSPISGAGYKYVPQHGAGKHSGVLGKFTMKGTITSCN